MRFALAAVLIAACAPRATAPTVPADAFGSFLGNRHVSRGPANPNAPLAKDADVTEGGGPISVAVGPAVVAPSVALPMNPPSAPTGPATGPNAATPTNPGSGTGATSTTRPR